MIFYTYFEGEGDSSSKFTVDISQSKVALTELQKLYEGLNTKLKDVTKTFVTFDKRSSTTEDKLKAKKIAISGITEEGEKLTRTFKVVASKSKETTAKLKLDSETRTKLTQKEIEANETRGRSFIAWQKVQADGVKASIKFDTDADKAREKRLAEYAKEVAKRQKIWEKEAKEAKKHADILQKEAERAAGRTRAGGVTNAIQSFFGNKPTNSAAKQDDLGILRATASLNKFVETNKVTADRLLSIWARVQKGEVSNFDVIDRQAAVHMANVGRAFENAASKAVPAGKKVLLSWQSVFRVIALQEIRNITFRFVVGLIEGTKRAAELSLRIAEIQTVSLSAKRTADDWAESLFRLSDSFGIDVIEAAKGQYQALSNQVGSVAQTQTFFAQAVKFAQVNVSNLAGAVDLLSSAVNSYDEGILGTLRSQAVLTKGIELGRFVADDLSNSLGRVTGLASGLGVNLEDVTAMLAVLTSSGLTAEKSLTLIDNIFNKLLKPTEAMEALFAKWGVTSGEAAIKTFGLVEVLQKLKEETKSGGIEVLGDFGGDLRAIRGFQGLLNNLPKFKDFNKQLNDTNRLFTEFDKKLQIISESPGKRFKVEIEKIKNIFTRDLGLAFVKLSDNLALGVAKMSDIFKSFAGTFSGFATAVAITVSPLTTFLGLLGKMEIVTKSLGALLAILTLRWGANKLGLAAYGEVLFKVGDFIKQHFLISIDKNIRANFDWAASWKTVKETIAGAALSIQASIGFITLGISALIGFILVTEESAAQAGFKLAEKFREKQEKLQEQLQRTEELALKKLGEKRRKASAELNKIFADVFKGLGEELGEKPEKALAKLEKSLEKIAEKSKEAFADIKQFNEDFAGRLLPEDQQLQGLQNRMQDIFAEATLEQMNGQLEDAAGLWEQAGDIAEDISKRRLKILEDLEKAIDKSKELKDEISNAFEDRKFERMLDGLTGGAKQGAITQRIQDVTAKALGLPPEKIDEARKLLEQADKLAQEAIKLDEADDKALKKFGVVGSIDPALLQQEEEVMKKKIELEDQFAKTVEATHRKVKDQILDNQLGVRPEIAKQQQAIADALQNEVDKRKVNLELLNQQKVLENEIRSITEGVDKTAADAKIALNKSAADIDKNIGDILKQFTDLKNNPFGLQSFFESIGLADTDTEDLFQEFGVDELLKKLGSTQDLTERAEIIRQLSVNLAEITNSLGQGRIETFGGKESIEALKTTLNAAALAAEGAKTLQEQFQDATKLQTAFETEEKILKNKLAQLQAEKDLNIQRQKANDLRKEFLENLQDKAEARASGGTLFASGGKGTDNIPAMLSRGETVINERSSRRFFTQLVAMNNGLARPLASGGSVHNFGDINVNVTGGSNDKITARGIAAELQRELRRQTIKRF